VSEFSRYSNTPIVASYRVNREGLIQKILPSLQ
jgi:hypothetical protein